jgi:hypothetical protein
MKKQWDLGQTCGCIIHSIFECAATGGDWEKDYKPTWVSTLVRFRKNPMEQKEFVESTKNVAGSWTPMRFELGFLHIFNPAEADARTAATLAAKGKKGGKKAAAKAAAPAAMGGGGKVVYSDSSDDDSEDSDDDYDSDE